MKKSTRRSFIRDTSLTATGLAVVSFTNKKHLVSNEAIGCAPAKINLLTGTITSVKSGKWSDPATWGGKLPQRSDTPLISSGHTVVYDLSITVISGININHGGVLEFDPNNSVKIETSKNMVVEGKLVMKPSTISIRHHIRFIGIIESNFVGGGMTPVSTDIGLWVMGAGVLDLVGAQKTPWTRLSGSAGIGASSISLSSTPQNWQVGDEIFIVPTDTPPDETAGFDTTTGEAFDKYGPKFEKRTIKSISDSIVTLDSPLLYDHNLVRTSDGKKTWTAEVGNLTRNVLIEGTAQGKTHIFVKSSMPSNLINVGIRYVGPRKVVSGQSNNRPDIILGRYGLHFHHCMDGSRGSKVLGCVMYDCGSRGYVPHVSHGITINDCIAFNFLDTPFWYDIGDVTHDAIWERNLMALCTYIPGTTHASKGMFLGQGDGNIARNNVAVYAGVGYPERGGAFTWEEQNEGVWTFEDNLSHSNHSGLWVWQNTGRNHTIDRFDSYNNKAGIVHGAYFNAYLYTDGYHYNSPVIVRASSSNSLGVVFTRIIFDGANNVDYVLEATDSPLTPESTNKFINCEFKGFRKAVCSMYLKPGSSFHNVKSIDFINCIYSGKLFVLDPNMNVGTFIRQQPLAGQCTKTEVGINKTIVNANIGRFAPDVWGTGKGLKGEYFNGSDFEKFAYSQIDSMIMFCRWSVDPLASPTGVHYLIGGDQFSVRWTGKIEAQYTEPYTFYLYSGGRVRLWINNVLVINNWIEMFDLTKFAQSQQINMIAGQKYDIKIEHSNSSGHRGCVLKWKCPSMEIIADVSQTQLYSENVVTVVPTVTNQGPVANAGIDQVITLPTTEITLNGGASIDHDGKINSFKWSWVSGPSLYKISSPTESTTIVNNLVQGTYVFKLSVTDDKGATHDDDVMITVNPQPSEVVNQKPIVNAGADILLTLPNNSATLNGTASKDVDGSIVSFKWLKVSGPSQYRIENPNTSTTALSRLAQGTYIFRLQATDDKGATSFDEVTVIVNAQIDQNTSTGTSLKVTVAPNPTKSFFKTTITGSSASLIKCSLYNRYGVLIDTRTCRSGETIDVGKRIKPGTYYGIAEQGTEKVSVTLIKL